MDFCLDRYIKDEFVNFVLNSRIDEIIKKLDEIIQNLNFPTTILSSIDVNKKLVQLKAYLKLAFKPNFLQSTLKHLKIKLKDILHNFVINNEGILYITGHSLAGGLSQYLAWSSPDASIENIITFNPIGLRIIPVLKKAEFHEELKIKKFKGTESALKSGYLVF